MSLSWILEKESVWTIFRKDFLNSKNNLCLFFVRLFQVRCYCDHLWSSVVCQSVLSSCHHCCRCVYSEARCCLWSLHTVFKQMGWIRSLQVWRNRHCKGDENQTYKWISTLRYGPNMTQSEHGLRTGATWCCCLWITAPFRVYSHTAGPFVLSHRL
jgi:hypothetical protein